MTPNLLQSLVMLVWLLGFIRLALEEPPAPVYRLRYTSANGGGV